MRLGCVWEKTWRMGNEMEFCQIWNKILRNSQISSLCLFTFTQLMYKDGILIVEDYIGQQ